MKLILKILLPLIFITLVLAIGFAIWTIFISKSPVAPSVSNKEVSLEYWGIYESEAVMQKLINSYQEQNPNIKIKYVQKTFDNLDEYRGTLTTRLAQGSGPSIFRMHSTWTNSLGNQMAIAKEQMSFDEYQKRFYPVAVKECTDSAGDVYCLPIMYDGLVLLYNKNMFKDANMTPQIVSWEDLRQTAIRLTRYDENQRNIVKSGLAIGTTNNVKNFSDIIALMFLQSEVKFPDDLSSGSAQQVFSFYKSFATRDKIWNAEMPSSTKSFAAEQTAMIFAKSTDILEILRLNPTLDFGVLPVPQLPKLGGGTTNKNWASFYVESVSADLDENAQKEAWKFLEWLSRPEQQILRFNESSVINPRKFGEAYGNAQLKNNLINAPLLGPILQGAPTAETSVLADESGNAYFVYQLRTIVDSDSPLSKEEMDKKIEEFKKYIR
ncbi:MAG: extracellular solute-binding protein [Niabella sp.]|nr:MAG: extracellular solute-binding protein [Niabella sp.]